MADYHKFVFDIKHRKFVGKFEEMYASEKEQFFDSWHQEDSRFITKQISSLIINQYQFTNILDIGSGKGAFTHTLKKNGNKVDALDVSNSALKTLAARYPDIGTICANINEDRVLEGILTKANYDFVYCSEVLSYLKNWKECIEIISKHVQYLLVVLYIPDDPIGFVDSEENLINTCIKNFEIVHDIRLTSEQKVILFLKSKQ